MAPLPTYTSVIYTASSSKTASEYAATGAAVRAETPYTFNPSSIKRIMVLTTW